MKHRSVFAIAAALAASGGLATAADVTGTITFKGAPPPEKEISPLLKDPQCGKMWEGQPPPKTRFYVVNDKGGLADVVVTVKGMSGKSTGKSAPPLEIDQLHCEYIPSIAAVQTGQKILVKNSDPLLHNVHTTPQAAGNKEINKAQLPKSPDLEFSFDVPENFLRFKCDVHGWMFSWVSVMDHPYFGLSDKEGKYKIASLPPGKYTIEAIHRKAGTASKEIEVKDQNVALDFEFEPPKDAK